MAISLPESISLGFIDFWSRKIRSFITLLGIVLGTMSIIVILSIVNGMNEMTLRWMNETGGVRKLTIKRNWQYQSTTNLPNYLKMKEVEYIKDNIPEVDAFNIEKWGWYRIKYNQNSVMWSVLGCLPEAQKTMQWTVSTGRFFNKHDYIESNDVIVIGSTVKENLFGPRNPIGQYITVNDKRLMVIGVMMRREMEGNMWSQNPLEYLNRQSFVPITTMINKLGEEDQINEITIQSINDKQSYLLKPILEDILLNLRKGQPLFTVESAIENVEQLKQNMKMFRVIFFFISAISLLVGGIVIMNIMLATIQERTREIGVRLAVGARPIDIFVQFLVQTIVVTFIGGALGVLLAMSIVDVVGKYLKMSTHLDIYMIVIALSISCIIGLFFGIYPSVKASKLDPVKALRYE